MARAGLGPRGAPVGSRGALRGGSRAPERAGPALSLLRDGGRARPQAQAPARTRSAAHLRQDGPQARRRRARAARSRGRRPHWRFRLDNSEEGLEPLPTIVSWNDLIRGDQTVDVGSLSDPVVIRADGTFLYTFTSVVDDADFKISHVIRGEDHVTNTGVQIELFEALGYEPPAFAHHSLLSAPMGTRCPSASAPSRSRAFARRVSSRWRSPATRR